MKKPGFYTHILFVAAFSAAAHALAAEAGYSLGIPGVPKIRNVSSAAGNVWLGANANFTAMSISVTTGGVSRADVAGAPQIALASAESGFAVERTKPEYYLGDEIEPPDDVDWSATYERYLADTPAGVLFDPVDRRVFVTEGGTIRVTWVLGSGDSVEMTYVVSGSCSGRPRRIYWTQSPYNGPGVNLNGKFVKFFGSPEIITPRYGTVTNTTGGVEQIIDNKIVSGLYLDPSSSTLYAYGELQGQVVMVYYDTGTYERMLHVQTVEVCRPTVNVLRGEIGRALKADGRGYGTDGLRARPTLISPSDGRGEYLYQHTGRYSYSPKNGNVYPLRPTTDCRWNAEIYWMETDEMEVEWPFELDHYECDWPTDATVFVRGDKNADTGRAIYIPNDYTATLMSYQEPEGHARAPGSDGVFETSGEGYSLLQLTGDDNIWFLPVHSVLRSNPAYFTLKPEEIAVGRELQMRGGTVAGTAEGYSPECDATSPGYIYAAASDPVWNTNLYKAPQAEVPGGISTNVLGSASGETNNYESVVYAVTANAVTGTNAVAPVVEVWWNSVLNDDDMPSAIAIPSLTQVYSVRWPVASENPEIVIASQLGSASESVFSHNAALYLDAADSYAELAERAYFSADGGTLMFWVRCREESADVEGNTALVSIATLDSDDNVANALVADVCRSADSTELRVACGAAATDVLELPNDGDWHHVALAFGSDGVLTRYLDGKNLGKAGFDITGFLGVDIRAIIGANDFNGECKARAGAEIGELLFWGRKLADDEIPVERHKTHGGTENALTGCYVFNDDDLAVSGTDRRTFTGKVLGGVHTAYKCLYEEDGPPAKGTGVIEADAGTTPRVYVQNDPGVIGYNPNEEHAFLKSGSGGHVAWALRSDLNTASSSVPGVLVEYVKGGRKAMQWFDVAVTNSVYTQLAGGCQAGKALPGPHPLDLFDDPWCAETYWDEPSGVSPAHRDRKGQLWARAAGDLTVHMYYPMQDGFAFPSLASDDWPQTGASVPWLSLLGESPESDSVLSAAPAGWLWRVSWPDEVPQIEIGRTLSTATSGLPEVWNAKSMAVVWPATDAERDATAVMFDPTVAQESGFAEETYASVSAAITDLGIKQGAGGNATLRNGKWTFDGLPPAISSRFYIDTAAEVTNCIKLVGMREDNPSGVELLHVNILSESEREVLLSLLDSTASPAGREAWREAVSKLAVTRVEPSRHRMVSESEEVVDYEPRDHYALFTMGATNYITLIENDSTNSLMNVAEGDPIHMHILKVVPKYYTGRVVTREDPLNLLSQQLSVVYAESFAGGAGDYIFEWRKCAPRSDGSVPTDFDGEYEQKFPPTAALTRFTIGHQGDTLADMVNTYYAMRYRAANESSPAWAAMGDAWSEWTDPPALAEGWVQRVLNNVTPFSQRMRDLVENGAETAVSMIEQAGAPYEGDVALNQENLASVGLIQLYETVLNKAESMSLTMGINDQEANKQLQLAVARLADLYNVLGDEAFTDAINPTIGFGSSFNTSYGWFEVKYGALSSALFAFDNQVPTLLDEELALLRGRSGENAPSTHISPYYNRLVWNVSKSPTGGETAYMINYNIAGENTGTLDENAAASMYPQGHGDAYGHYLSALSGYYRLLRNPYFSWGAPSMGEMVVADSVLNVDYYDEAQFAKAACNVARTALEAVDRTARKAYRDAGGATGAGYLDNDSARNFGYGEWASRGGFGALCNWAVGNSLLPAQPKSSAYLRHQFTGEGTLTAWLDECDMPQLATNGDWTVEFRLVPAEQTSDNATAALVSDTRSMLGFTLDTSLSLFVTRTAIESVQEAYNCQTLHYLKDVSGDEPTGGNTYSTFSVTNGYEVFEYGFYGDDAPSSLPEGFEPGMGSYPSWEGWTCSNVDENGAVVPYEYQFVVDTYTSADTCEKAQVCTLEKGKGVLVSLRSSQGSQYVSVFDVSLGVKLAEVALPFQIGITPVIAELGSEYKGEIGELRVWGGVVRTDDELLAKRDYVIPNSSGLALYLRAITMSRATSLTDEVASALVWEVDGGTWIEESESGMSIGFEDEGLKRIDRSTVAELESLSDIVPQIQRKVDQMDAGLNPLGLATGAIPFDITPVNLADGGKTHFEQIRERAGTALANARQSLEKAQEYGSRLRLIQESQSAKEDELETMELEMKNKLIEYFGYPYEGDIGPGGTYPQGYDGPDLCNYTWMEPSLYGLNEVEDTITVRVITKEKPQFYNIFVPFWSSSTTLSKDPLKFELSASGLVLKPATVTGKRRAQGKIQDALADFIVAMALFKSKYSVCMSRLEDFETSVNSTANITSPMLLAKLAVEEAGTISGYYAAGVKANLLCTINSLEALDLWSDEGQEQILASIPSIQGAGMTVNIDPKALASAAVLAPGLADAATRGSATLAAKNALAILQAGQTWVDILSGSVTSAADYAINRVAMYETLRNYWYDYVDAKSNMLSAYRALLAAQATVETVIAEAERILDERTLARQQAADSLTKERYNDMFLRLARNNALSRYSSQFDLAQKYAYLAAQAYDYETGLLSSDPSSGEKFRARIVGTRTLGEFDADGNPTVASDAVKGDGGLAAILAEMDANWLVIKPRLGINNPQPYATWFSLRHDLFRIYSGEDGDKEWKKELRKYVVDDLNSIPEFRHYCQPLSGSTAEKEPGIVIPFPSFIAHGHNFFGEKLAGGDAALDSTYYATRIASAGIHFEGFDDTVLAKTPTVFLVPVGEDRMRAVGDSNTVLSWKVVDQTIPAPYSIGSTELDDPDWTPLYDGATGGNDAGARIRKHPSFRAYYAAEGAAPDDASLDCTRLVGRSAWNTRWLLVIPAGSLGSDREAAISAFVNGVDSDRDGKLDFKGVSDIKLGLKTYSTSGN